MRDYELDSDLKQSKFITLNFVQYDNGSAITVNVFEEGQSVDLTNCSVIAKYKRADGKEFNRPAVVKDNKIVATLDSTVTSVAGVLKIIFKIVYDEKQVSSFILLANVIENFGEGDSGNIGGNTDSTGVTVDLSDYYNKQEIDTQFENIANLIKSGNIGNNVEPQLMDMPRIYFSEGNLPTTKTATTLKFDYYSKTAEYHGWAKIKCQGNSSMSYNKKNFTIKLYKDKEKTQKLKIDFKGWGKQSKFVLKANWIDITHARNIVSARIWGDIVKSRTGYANLPELLRTSPNQGAIDGFPITVYGNGYYQGRYTLNIPKDKWMTNMDDALDTHCILCGENYGSGCFRVLPVINGTDWTDEIHDTVPDIIKTSWINAINFVMNSTDEEFKQSLHNYFDVESLIDYLLFGIMSTGFDAFGKNQIYMTYNGTHWIASMYDMDGTWGLFWTGSLLSTDYSREQYEDYKNSTGNLLYVRLQKLFLNELKSRYAELKQNIFTYTYLINKFEEFTQICPLDTVKEDYATTTANGTHTGIPSKTNNNIQQIRSYINTRLSYVDSYINELVEPISCTSITLDNSTLLFENVDSQTLIATLTPENTTDSINWSSDNTDIATVENGVVTPIGNGSCTITAICGSKSVTCNIEVNLPIISVDELSLDKNIITLGTLEEDDDSNINYLDEAIWKQGVYSDFEFITTNKSDYCTSAEVPYAGIYEFASSSALNLSTFKCLIIDDNAISTLQYSSTGKNVKIAVLKPNVKLGVSFYPSGESITDDVFNTMSLKRIAKIDTVTKDIEVLPSKFSKPAWCTSTEINTLESTLYLLGISERYQLLAIKFGDILLKAPFDFNIGNSGNDESKIIDYGNNGYFSWYNNYIRVSLPIDKFGVTYDEFEQYLNDKQIIINPSDYINSLETAITKFEDKLTATLTPKNATNKNVTWSSDNENVELVPDGLNCTVKAKAVGSSVITCTSEDTTNGTVKDTCNIIVNDI